MGIEEIFVPVATVVGIDGLDVETHYCREDLGNEENYEAG